MSFQEFTCYVPECDDCGPDCWDGDENGPPHFVGANVAAAQVLADQHGWTIEKLADGTVWMLCARCAKRRECDQGGHHWYTPEVSTTVPTTGRPVELCVCCGIVRRDHNPFDVPPARHPESMDIVLSDEDEDWLAELDGLTWPDDADEHLIRDAIAHLETHKER